MSPIDPDLVPPRTTSLHHTFPNATTATMIRSFDSGEWEVESHVLRKSQSVTGLRPRTPRHVTRLSRMGSLEGIARRVEIWSGKHDTVSAIAEHGWFDDHEADEDEIPGRSSREQENVALILPLVPRKSSKRQRVAKRRGVSGLTRLLKSRYIKEEPTHDIFQKHLQSELTYSEKKKLGFEYATPGSKEMPVMQTVLDQRQQEGIDRLKSKPLPPLPGFGVDGPAAEQVRRAQQKTKTKLDNVQPIPRDFARSAGAGKARQNEAGGAEGLFNTLLASKNIGDTPGSAAAAVHEARRETLGLARSARNPLTTTQEIDQAAAKALSTNQDQSTSFFEQSPSKKIKIQLVLTKLKSIRRRQVRGNETGTGYSICRLDSKALTLKLKHILNIRRRADQEPVEDVRVASEAESKAHAKERARVFETQKRHLLHDIHVARRTKHQRWLEAESEMARAQDRPPNPIPPMQTVSLHPELESEAQIHAKALDAALDEMPGTKWRSNSQITTITTSKPSGFMRIVGPPNYGMLCLCNLWLDLGYSLGEKATNHMHQIERGHLPKDHILSGCDCHLYRIYEAFTNDEYRWIGIAQTQKEEKGRWVVYLAKENPISKYLMGSRMPPTNVPARKPTSANKPRPKSATFIKQIRRKSRQGIFYASKGLRDVGAT